MLTQAPSTSLLNDDIAASNARIDLDASLDDGQPISCLAPQSRGLIVGQAPPAPLEKLPPGYLPFQGLPERRLARLAGVQSPAVLWSSFDRLDLLGWCPGPKDRKPYHMKDTGYRKHQCDGHRFPIRDARLAASRLVTFGRLAESYAIVVLCGRLVALCFGLKIEGKFVPWMEELEGIRYLVMPHPSGVSHYWNDQASWHRAAGAFRASMRVFGLGVSSQAEHCHAASTLPSVDAPPLASGPQAGSAIEARINGEAAFLKQRRLAKAAVRRALKRQARQCKTSSTQHVKKVVRSRFFAVGGVGKASASLVPLVAADSGIGD